MAEQELVEFLKSQGHSDERAQQIASNHPDAERADFEASKAKTPAPTEANAEPQESDEPTDLVAIGRFVKDKFQKMIDAIKGLEDRHERLVDHVNREIGVSGDAPLVARVRDLETRIVAEKSKGVPDGTEKAPAPEEKSATETPEPNPTA